MNISSILHLAIVLTVGLIALLFATNFVGKTQISQGTPFHFISALILGELVGNAVYDPEVSVFNVLFAIFLWAFLMYIIETITQKFRKSRKFFEGNPSILIRNGRIDFNELKKNKMDISELQRSLREKDVFSIREVEYGILESNGSISVMKKWRYDSPTNEELNLSEKPTYLPVTLISDGEIFQENLKDAGYDEKWLMNQLHMQGISEVRDVFYADWHASKGLHVISY